MSKHLLKLKLIVVANYLFYLHVKLQIVKDQN